MASRPFMDFLREHGRGETHDLLSDMLHELVEAVAEANKVGKLVVTITMKPAGEHGAFALLVEAVSKLPKSPAKESLYFVTPENNLTRQSPQQILDLAGPSLVQRGLA